MRNPTSEALIAVAVLGLSLAPAQAGPCTEQIAQMDQRVRQSPKTPVAGPTATQTVGAQLGHQPTPQSVQQAEAKAQEDYSTIIQRAKDADAAGDRAACVKALEEAKRVYEFR